MDLKPSIRWYVVMNGNEAAIYRSSKEVRFALVEKIRNPRGSLQERELDSDRPGRGISSASRNIRHALDRTFHKHSKVMADFIKRMVRILVNAENNQEFTEWVLVAEPRLTGLMKAALTPSLQKKLAI